MSTDQPAEDAFAGDDGDDVDEDERPPDESTLLGHTGVQAEIEAEAARAEAELLDGDGGSDDPGIV